MSNMKTPNDDSVRKLNTEITIDEVRKVIKSNIIFSRSCQTPIYDI